MFIGLETGASIVEWEFLDSGAFSAWINVRPWRSGGGVRVLRLPDMALLPACCQSIQRAVYAAELGDQGLKLFMPDLEDGPSQSLSGSLTQALSGEQRVLDRIGLRKRMIVELNRCPIFFTISSSPSYALGMIADAKSLSEELQKEKQPPVYPLTILFVEGAEASGGDADLFDYSVGFPRQRLFENTRFESELWFG